MVRVFLFHRVNHQRDKIWDPMDVSLFEKCIKYITDKYEVVQLEKLIENIDYQSKKEYASIVFDDGYKDNIENAAPILQKYNCKASFYIVTDCIENNIPTWTYNLDYCFQYTNIANIDLSLPFLPEMMQVSKLSTHTDRIFYLKKLKPFLKRVSHDERDAVLKQVFETYTDIELPHIMLNWDDVRELSNAGHYIGSHSATHSVLAAMANEDEIRSELLLSGEAIEKNVGYFPKIFSYPIGSYNETTIRICKEVGYSAGLAVKQRVYNPLKDDLFEIPRIELYNEPWWKTRLRITNLLEGIKSTIRYK